MNINKFTIKSQEAIQLSQRLAQDLDNSKSRTNIQSMLEVDEM
jgi:ATP-dependent Clp protease ATP-binding subunit ClpB